MARKVAKSRLKIDLTPKKAPARAPLKLTGSALRAVQRAGQSVGAASQQVAHDVGGGTGDLQWDMTQGAKQGKPQGGVPHSQGGYYPSWSSTEVPLSTWITGVIGPSKVAQLQDGSYALVQGNGKLIPISKNPNTILGHLTQTSGGATPARYQTSDAVQILSDIQSSGQLANVQAQLKAMGLITGSTSEYATPAAQVGYIQGTMDAHTTSAFREVLSNANSLGVSWQDILSGPTSAAVQAAGGYDALIRSGVGALATGGSSGGSGDSGYSSSYGYSKGGGGGGSSSGSASNLPDQVQLGDVVDTISQNEIGKELDPLSRANIVNQIDAQITAANNDPNATKFDVDSQVRALIRQQFPGQAATNDVMGTMDSFMQMMKSGPSFSSPDKSNVGPQATSDASSAIEGTIA